MDTKTPAQIVAAEKLARDGVIFAGTGVTLATARVLHRLGLGTLTTRLVETDRRGKCSFGRGGYVRTTYHTDWNLTAN